MIRYEKTENSLNLIMIIIRNRLLKIGFSTSFIILILVLSISCTNKQFKDEKPKYIEVAYIGPMDWSVPKIIFCIDTLELHSNKYDLNILLTDSAFNNIDKLSEDLDDDSSVYSDKSTFSGIKIKNYYNKHTQMKRIKLDLGCDYLKKVLQILAVNEIDTNKINLVKYIDSYICGSINPNKKQGQN